MVEDELKYLKSNDIVRGEYFKGELIGLTLPPKIIMTVKEAPDAVAGNTTSGAMKKIILENGLEIMAPLFIKEGEKVVINTETGEYSERAKE